MLNRPEALSRIQGIVEFAAPFKIWQCTQTSILSELRVPEIFAVEKRQHPLRMDCHVTEDWAWHKIAQGYGRIHPGTLQKTVLVRASLIRLYPYQSYSVEEMRTTTLAQTTTATQQLHHGLTFLLHLKINSFRWRTERFIHRHSLVTDRLLIALWMTVCYAMTRFPLQHSTCLQDAVDIDRDFYRRLLDPAVPFRRSYKSLVLLLDHWQSKILSFVPYQLNEGMQFDRRSRSLCCNKRIWRQ